MKLPRRGDSVLPPTAAELVAARAQQQTVVVVVDGWQQAAIHHHHHGLLMCEAPQQLIAEYLRTNGGARRIQLAGSWRQPTWSVLFKEPRCSWSLLQELQGDVRFKSSAGRQKPWPSGQGWRQPEADDLIPSGASSEEGEPRNPE